MNCLIIIITKLCQSEHSNNNVPYRSSTDEKLHRYPVWALASSGVKFFFSGVVNELDDAFEGVTSPEGSAAAAAGAAAVAPMLLPNEKAGGALDDTVDGPKPKLSGACAFAAGAETPVGSPNEIDGLGVPHAWPNENAVDAELVAAGVDGAPNETVEAGANVAPKAGVDVPNGVAADDAVTVFGAAVAVEPGVVLEDAVVEGAPNETVGAAASVGAELKLNAGAGLDSAAGAPNGTAADDGVLVIGVAVAEALKLKAADGLDSAAASPLLVLLTAWVTGSSCVSVAPNVPNGFALEAAPPKENVVAFAGEPTDAVLAALAPPAPPPKLKLVLGVVAAALVIGPLLSSFVAPANEKLAAPPNDGVAPPPNENAGAGLESDEVVLTAPNKLGAVLAIGGCEAAGFGPAVVAAVVAVFAVFALATPNVNAAGFDSRAGAGTDAAPLPLPPGVPNAKAGEAVVLAPNVNLGAVDDATAPAIALALALLPLLLLLLLLLLAWGAGLSQALHFVFAQSLITKHDLHFHRTPSSSAPTGFTVHFTLENPSLDTAPFFLEPLPSASSSSSSSSSSTSSSSLGFSR
jgi:hypothetical protein